MVETINGQTRVRPRYSFETNGYIALHSAKLTVIDPKVQKVLAKVKAKTKSQIGPATPYIGSVIAENTNFETIKAKFSEDWIENLKQTAEKYHINTQFSIRHGSSYIDQKVLQTKIIKDYFSRHWTEGSSVGDIGYDIRSMLGINVPSGAIAQSTIDQLLNNWLILLKTRPNPFSDKRIHNKLVLPVRILTDDLLLDNFANDLKLNLLAMGRIYKYKGYINAKVDLRKYIIGAVQATTTKKYMGTLLRDQQILWGIIYDMFHSYSQFNPSRNPLTTLARFLDSDSHFHDLYYYQTTIRNALKLCDFFIDNGIFSIKYSDFGKTTAFLETIFPTQLLNRIANVPDISGGGSTKMTLRAWLLEKDSAGNPNYMKFYAKGGDYATKSKFVEACRSGFMNTFFVDGKSVSDVDMEKLIPEDWQVMDLRSLRQQIHSWMQLATLGHAYNAPVKSKRASWFPGIGFNDGGQHGNNTITQFVDRFKAELGIPVNAPFLEKLVCLHKSKHYLLDSFLNTMEDFQSLVASHALLVNNVGGGFKNLMSIRNSPYAQRVCSVSLWTKDKELMFDPKATTFEMFLHSLAGYHDYEKMIPYPFSRDGKTTQPIANSPPELVTMLLADTKLKNKLIGMFGCMRLKELSADLKAGIPYKGKKSDGTIAKKVAELDLLLRIETNPVLKKTIMLLFEVLGYKTGRDGFYDYNKDKSCPEGVKRGMAQIYLALGVSTPGLYNYYKSTTSHIGKITPLLNLVTLLKVIVTSIDNRGVSNIGTNLQEWIQNIHLPANYLLAGISDTQAFALQDAFGIDLGVIRPDMLRWWVNFAHVQSKDFTRAVTSETITNNLMWWYYNYGIPSFRHNLYPRPPEP
ncbi:MAG: hypothetical protein ACTSWW_06025 [Promethearchaeota archaeon]